MVELWLVRLDLGKVSVVKVTRVLQVCVPEYDDPATFVPDSQEIT